MPAPPGPAVSAFAAAFGITAALLIVVGAIVLGAQRNRLRHALLMAALERGVSAFPGVPPLWLISLRRGVSTFVLGLALFLIGAAVQQAAMKVPQPPQQIAATPPPAVEPPGAEAPEPPPGLAEPPPGPREQLGPLGRRGHQMLTPPAPAMELWLRAQDHKAVGGFCEAVGVILVLLGFVRVIFAFAERRYAPPPILSSPR